MYPHSQFRCEQRWRLITEMWRIIVKHTHIPACKVPGDLTQLEAAPIDSSESRLIQNYITSKHLTHKKITNTYCSSSTALWIYLSSWCVFGTLSSSAAYPSYTPKIGVAPKSSHMSSSSFNPRPSVWYPTQYPTRPGRFSSGPKERVQLNRDEMSPPAQNYISIYNEKDVDEMVPCKLLPPGIRICLGLRSCSTFARSFLSPFVRFLYVGGKSEIKLNQAYWSWSAVTSIVKDSTLLESGASSVGCKVVVNCFQSIERSAVGKDACA